MIFRFFTVKSVLNFSMVILPLERRSWGELTNWNVRNFRRHWCFGIWDRSKNNEFLSRWSVHSMSIKFHVKAVIVTALIHEYNRNLLEKHNNKPWNIVYLVQWTLSLWLSYFSTHSMHIRVILNIKNPNYHHLPQYQHIPIYLYYMSMT